MRITVPLFALSLLTLAPGCGEVPEDVNTETYALDPQGDAHGQPEPPMLGVHHARGEARTPGGGTTSPLLTWHNGPVMPTAKLQSIYWGASWANASFVGDKLGGLEQLYRAYANSSYARTNIEYTGSNGTVVTATDITVDDALVDTSSAGTRAPRTSAVLAEVCKEITSPVANGYYPVYTDIKRGSAGYCAWHSWGSCGGVAIQFGFFFNLDGDPGCDPKDTTVGRSQGLAALANVTGHELSETVTDPRGTGWTDSSGAENADKCAWVFDQPVTLATGPLGAAESWRIQGNWSNAAYNSCQPSSTTSCFGLPNSSAQKGCLYAF